MALKVSNCKTATKEKLTVQQVQSEALWKVGLQEKESILCTKGKVFCIPYAVILSFETAFLDHHGMSYYVGDKEMVGWDRRIVVSSVVGDVLAHKEALSQIRLI